MEKYDRMTSLFLVFLSILICILSTRLPVGLGTLRDPGPAFLPFWSGVVMGLLSLVLFFRSIRRRIEEKGESWFPKEHWVSLVLVLAALAAYAVVLDSLGFLIDTFLLMFFLFRIMGAMKWMWAIGGSIIFSLASFGIFDLWLKVQLPKGFLGV